MRQRVIYLLKHNKTLLSVYRVVMSLVFKIWGSFVITDEQLVLVVSFMGKGFNDSPKVIYDYLKSHHEYNRLRIVWAFEKPEKFPDVMSVKIDTIKYFITAFKAKYWITNTNIERGLHFKKNDQIYLNTWHGTALKLIGNDCPGRKDFDFSNVNYLVVSGTYDEKIWKSAFHANSESFLRCGLPRNEELWNVDASKRDFLREKMSIPEGKKVILYAPTWRESSDGGRSYQFKPPIHFEKWEKELSGDYVVLFRAHHQTTDVLGIKYDSFIRDVSSYPCVNDLMIVSDCLITDYSAIAFDYSILCKPILCFAYDYDSYLQERGTYFDIDEKYPNKSCRTEEDLLHRIKSLDYPVEYRKVKQFREEFIQYGMNATELCTKALFG